MPSNTSLRNIFSENLIKLSAKLKNITVLDADLNNQLNTLAFAKIYPDRHHTIFNSESSLLSLAAGMCIRKKTPIVIVNASNLLSRGLDILRNAIAQQNLNIKIILLNPGISNIECGLAHTITEDIAILRTLPNLKVLTPVDQYELKSMLDWSLNEFGPIVLRIYTNIDEEYLDSNYQFEMGKIKALASGDQIALISSGFLMKEVWQASIELQRKGLSTSIFNLSSFNSIKSKEFVQTLNKFEIIATIEDHSIYNGIGSMINELLLENNINKKVIKLAFNDIPAPGKLKDILDQNNLSAQTIYSAIRDHWIGS